MATIKNTQHVQQYNSKYSLTLGKTLAFASSNNLVKEVKNVSENFKQIAVFYAIKCSPSDM